MPFDDVFIIEVCESECSENVEYDFNNGVYVEILIDFQVAHGH